MTDCYTLFRDAYHLAGIEMPDFHREDDWWRHGQNLYLDNLEATGLYQVPLSSAQPGDVLLCCFGSSVPNHAAIYCGDGELLHHIPEQLSKRERYTDKWQRRTHSSGVTGHGAHLPLRGFATIWPPHRPSCKNGGRSHPGAGHADPGVSSEAERRLVSGTDCRA
ncbi:NlpC/P60 family protein [Escherichia coli]|nr:NlpC/P60 family protein [Escherichia coli]